MMLEPIVKTIEVPCSQEKAFGVFIDEMDSWWPMDRFSVSALGCTKPKTLRVDAKQGGRIVEIATDDAEHPWGTITSYDPFGFLSMDFHIAHPMETTQSESVVEVRFTSIGEQRTRVELTQSNWEAFGDMAEMVYSGYGGAWVVIFEQGFKKAAGG